MPRLTPSAGSQRFKSAFPEEFARWLQYELLNAMQWNRKLISDVSGGLGCEFVCRNQFGKQLWRATLEEHNQGIVFHSMEPKVYIRKGLYINMGKGQVIVEATSA